MPLRDLIGAYAGEIGQTQLLPSSYIKYGIDYDGGNGHVDLRHSVPDVLASTANLLKTNGWRAGAPFTAGTPNFEVAMREWNHSEVYRKTIVLMAQRLGGGQGAGERRRGDRVNDRDSCTLPMLHRAVASRRTVDMGHERMRWLMEVVSAVIPKTDTNRDRRNVRFGPTADIVADGSTWITHPLGIVRLVDLDHLRQQPCAVQIPESVEALLTPITAESW